MITNLNQTYLLILENPLFVLILICKRYFYACLIFYDKHI